MSVLARNTDLGKKFSQKRFWARHTRIWERIWELSDISVKVADSQENKEAAYEEERTRVFYCDAGCPYQKGAIEVNHELIRRILPKGTSFDNLTQKDVTRMMDHINSYKRKKLNDRSPYETFSFHYGEEVLKLLGCTPVAAEDILLKPTLLK